MMSKGELIVIGDVVFIKCISIDIDIIHDVIIVTYMIVRRIVADR